MCVNLALQSTLPINNLSAYATLYGIFHSVCKPGKYTAHVLPKKKHPKHNSDKVHSLLTHQRNCSYGCRQSRRSTAASSMGFAPGEGSSSACASAAKQPSLPRSLSPALPAPPLCQRYKTDVSTWSGRPARNSHEAAIVKAARGQAWHVRNKGMDCVQRCTVSLDQLSYCFITKPASN